MTKAERGKVQAAEMRPLRVMIGKTRMDRIRNEEIRRRVGTRPVLEKVDLSKLRWLGHLERMDERRSAKEAYNWKPESAKRPPGRPRIRWRDDVEDCLERYGLPSLGELREEGVLQDRGRWKRMLTPLTEHSSSWERKQEVSRN